MTSNQNYQSYRKPNPQWEQSMYLNGPELAKKLQLVGKEIKLVAKIIVHTF